MDEFGAGPQYHHQSSLHGQTPVSYAIALLAAIVSSLLMFHALFGRIEGPNVVVVAEGETLLTPYQLLQDESEVETTR